ncbi:MAG: hypothetical protein ABI240_11905 [Sphingomonas sp.]
MKKLVILPMIAVAALGLAACKHDTPAPGNDISNEVSLNSESMNTMAPEDSMLNETAVDNATAIDNATAPVDTASNATAK